MGTGSNQHETTRIVVLFDGVCNLCNGFVNWVIDRDPGAACLFLPLQSEAGRAIVRAAGRDPDELETIVVIESGRASIRSDAALRVGRRLGSPWSGLARLGGVVPRPLRDLVYRLVARWRYRLFGRQEACRLPTPELSAHFLDESDTRAAFEAAGLDPAAR
jgi:predicted DCC family thiol-disulfide oxidoreductase YuxK